MKIEVSNGEIVDKITILQIKEKYITDNSKLKNVKIELEELTPLLENIINTPFLSSFYSLLHEVNLQLWDIEDKLREKELKEEFDEEFIQLARSVYYTNDERAIIKKDINTASGSKLIEEKSYKNYTNKNN
jgi:hypothetical protein